MKVTTDACLFGAWVSEQINNEKSVINNCLDIGTGTGILSLMIAQKNPEAIFDAIEIDDSAAAQAIANVAGSPWAERINIIQDDIKSFDPGKKYDMIISNPPFYEKELKADNNQKNIAHHNEGLLLSELPAIIASNLKENGSFYLLLPYKRQNEIRKMLTEQKLSLRNMTLVRQSTSHDYFRIMLQGTLTDEKKETGINEISIKGEKEEYTPEFVYLLKDYYLNL